MGDINNPKLNTRQKQFAGHLNYEPETSNPKLILYLLKLYTHGTLACKIRTIYL